MKNTGITRKVDELGRIVLPIEIRRRLSVAEHDALEIYVDGDSCILKKYLPSCIFCHSTKDLSEFKEKLVCKKCATALKNGLNK
ncbi:MAG: AbrB/MazE/SpoVT family DNA-binding domain-containing protein [Clostridiales bacterium]|jgi:transcriptional pleiotropic regulator of transition state genes|nr:AbrB/MazE/SpoVT family DNA-binding domain-containing protein [Clostridiales bacterium]